MAIHNPKTKVQRQFLINTERAQAAGVVYGTANEVYHALLGSLTYCNFGHSMECLTDEYLNFLIDELWNRAFEQLGDCSVIKWVGKEK